MRSVGVFLSAVVAAALFSGCSDSESIPPASIPTQPTVTLPLPTDDPENVTEYNPFHTHDYWNGRTQYFLFDQEDIRIGHNDQLQQQRKTDEQDRTIIGFYEFTPESDGDDPPGQSANKEDTVLQGTKQLDITISWTNTDQVQNIPGLRFRFHHAGTPLFSNPFVVPNDEKFTIPLEPRWADMAHQRDVSRWAFSIEAYDPQMEALPNNNQVHKATGTVSITIEAINGGGRFIDPPHPFFFAHGPRRSAGEIWQNVSANCVIVNDTKATSLSPALPYESCAEMYLRDYAAKLPYIVPWETTKLLVDFYYNITDNAPIDRELGLIFHDAQSVIYRYPLEAEGSVPGHKKYEIVVTEAMSDSPYATSTDWRFGIFPIINGYSEYGGHLPDAKIHITLIAVKEGSTSDRGNR